MVGIKRKLRVAELYAGTCRSIEPYRSHSEFEVALLADINVKAREAYLANHDTAPYTLMDLEKESAAEIERKAGGRIDVLLGCPPCQGFSESGKRRAEDPRNNHILKFGRLVRTLKPAIFAMENVPLAAVSGQFADFRTIIEAAGYEMAAAVLNAAEYGSAQARQRLVAVGRRGRGSGLDVSLPSPTHAPIGDYFDYAMGELRRYNGRDDALLGTTSSARRAATVLPIKLHKESDLMMPTPQVGDVIGALPTLGDPRAIQLTHLPFGHSEAVRAAMASVAAGGRRDVGGRYHGAAYGRLHERGLAKTLTCYFSNAGSGRFWHPSDDRSLTIREAARLQGFHDNFLFPAGATEASTFMVGNALDSALSCASFRAVERLL